MIICGLLAAPQSFVIWSELCRGVFVIQCLQCIGFQITDFTAYHLPDLLIVLSSVPQRAAHCAADRLMEWVVYSFPKR